MNKATTIVALVLALVVALTVEVDAVVVAVIACVVIAARFPIQVLVRQSCSGVSNIRPDVRCELRASCPHRQSNGVTAFCAVYQ